MIIETSIICSTVVAVTAAIFIHFDKERKARAPILPPPTIDQSVIDELREDIKRVDAKITKASLNRVFS